jgi:hypothetical protein
VVVGGVLSVTVTALWSILFKPLRDVDQLTTEALLSANAMQTAAEPVE